MRPSPYTELYERATGLRPSDAPSEVKDDRLSRKTRERQSLIAWKPFMDGLEARTGRKIKNRLKFCECLNRLAWVYRFENLCEEGPTPKEQLIYYEAMTQHFHDFRTSWELLLHTGPAPIAEPLMLAMRVDGSDDRYATEDPIERMKRMREDLDRFDRLLHKARGIAREVAKPHRRGGRRPRNSRKLIIGVLSKLYEKEIGLRAGTSEAFVALVRDFFDVVEPGRPKNSGLAQTIKVTLQEYRECATGVGRAR